MSHRPASVISLAVISRAVISVAAISLAVISLGCTARGHDEIVCDLARRTPAAERWSAREVILFGTPAAEPYQADGFHREAAGGEGDSFLWTKREAEVSLTWPAVAPRAAVVELAPYRGIKAQSVEVTLNGKRVGRFALNDLRHRYRLALAADAQRPGENRLRFAFAAAASPSDAGSNAPDRRQLAAAFYSLVMAPEGDPALDDLLGRDAPRPFSVVESGGIPTLVQLGTSVVRYAIRLPEKAELRFTPDLQPLARAGGAAASFRVTVEDQAGEEHEIWSRVITARDRRPAEVALALPGAPRSIVGVGLHVGGAPSDRFAWGMWTAPRILGRGEADPLEARPLPPEESDRAGALRRSLLGSNVLLIILDAARASEFGCYGYRRPTTPEIDRIAREGVVFENVYTPAAYTLGAMSSVWTSQYPDRHHAEVSFSAPLPKDRLTLADVLSSQGIPTAGFVANMVAGGFNGFDRGFTEFHEVWRETGSRGDAFRRTLPRFFDARKADPFFAYVHFREPHFPYDPEPPFDTRFGPDGPIPKAARRDPQLLPDINQGRRPATRDLIEHIVRLYDGNLAFADQEIGALRKEMEAGGLWDRTVVMIAADHGEGLWEHGWVGHNVQVYEESIHVPLVVRFPAGKGPAGMRVRAFADLLDFAPTIADVFGVLGKGPSAHEFQGRTLLPLIAGAPGKPAVLSRTVWDRPRYALRDERFSYVYETRTGQEELYDVARDPRETRDVRAEEPLRAAYYRQALHHWIARLGRQARGSAEGPVTMTREQCETLRSLGYITAGCPQP